MSASASRAGDATQARRAEIGGMVGGLAPVIGGFVLLLAVAGISAWLFAVSHDSVNRANRSLKVRAGAYYLLTIVQDAETGQRGYLLARDPAYLAPYRKAVEETPGTLASLRAVVDGKRATAIDTLQVLIQRKLDELASTVVAAEAGNFDRALAIVRNNSGNNLMTDIRREITQFQDEEAASQAAANAAVDKGNLLLAFASVGGIAIVLLLGTYTIVGFRRNTRDLMKAQQGLRHTNENLEGLVAERVAELQLANEEIQRFAYIVSHDLRAPLVNVMGFTSELDAVRGDIAGLLADAEKTAPQLVTPARKAAVENDLPEALSFIRSSTSKMDRLINAILKLSREGRRVLTPQPVDLHALVAAQGQSLAQQFEAGEAKLVVQDDLPDIVSDRLAVEQIFGNLIENAAKYLQRGRPGLVEVTGEVQGAYQRYRIKDNGRGIDAKDFERVFELFRRSGEQDQPGEGIGLAYVRNLARRLGGNVTVQSEFGQGSTFTVTLPTVFQTKGKAAK